MYKIFCLKWGTKYSSEYVNNLHNMVKRNLTVPFEFVCFTDDVVGIDEHITTKPLIDENLKGWWGKVSYFKTPLLDFNGTALALDLDMVIVDNIDCFFHYPGDFCIMKDYIPQNGNNSSVMRFEINNCRDIYDDLDISNTVAQIGTLGERHISTKYWGDQVWITEKRTNAITFPTSWIRSYKWECLDSSGNLCVPDDCKIILFHGLPNPHEVPHHVGQWWK